MLTQEKLKRMLHYDLETGIFTWKINRRGNTKMGTRAGHSNDRGYIVIGIEEVTHKAHRLAWLYITGLWPKAEIDHRNGVKDDNRWINLREATRTQNKQNKVIQANNTSGVRGVSRQNNKWRVQIKFNGKQHHLGYFNTLEEAKEVYVKAAREAFGRFYNEDSVC